MYKISFFASAIRPHLWPKLLESLKRNNYEYEVVFAGFIDPKITNIYTDQYKELKYILTENIKPSQCYEIARKHCTGELVCWMDDDHIFSEGFVDKVYDYFIIKRDEWLKESKPEKGYCPIIIATDYVEKDSDEKLEDFRFFARNLNTPQMPLVGVMSREYLDILGGIDRRYIISRWMCDIAMRVLADDGKVYPLKTVLATLDSKNKAGLYNNFWSGWNEDSETLENSWVIGGYKRFENPLLVLNGSKTPYWYTPISNREVTFKRNDQFEPFKQDNIMKITQGLKGQWL